MKTLILKIVLMLPLPLESQHVESFLQSHGIRARVHIVRLEQPLVLGNQLEYFYTLEQAFRSSKETYIHVLTDPFIDAAGKENMLGLGKHKSRFSYSVWNNENSAGIARTIHSEVAMLHELGHSIGNLNHTTQCKTIMDEAAMACQNVSELKFTSSQLAAIKRQNNYAIRRHRK